MQIPEERFWNYVDKTPGHGPEGECWQWAATKVCGGYGQFWDGTRNMRAHRFSWDLHNVGKELGKLCVLHNCDNPGCVNPSHLFLGTPLDNMRDMMAKGRDRHPKGERNGAAKLTEDQVLDIYGDSRSLRKIATDYPIHWAHVSRIKSGEKWAHLTGHVQC